MTSALADGIRGGMWLRGAALVGAGLIALIWPEEGARAAAVLVAVILVVDGATITAKAIRKGGSLRGLFAVQGLAGVALGLLSIALSGDAQRVAVAFAVWSLVAGTIDAIAAIRVGTSSPASGLLGTGAVLSIVAGVLLLAAPDGDLRLALQLFGAYQLGRGVVALSLVARWTED